MIKLTFCLRRLPSLTREEFQAYWITRHAPLVAGFAETLKIRRYVQLHSLPPELSAPLGASRGAPDDYDGVAQLWFDSLDDVAAGADDPAARDAGLRLLEDERKFIDHARSPLWWGEEKVIVPPLPPRGA